MSGEYSENTTVTALTGPTGRRRILSSRRTPLPHTFLSMPRLGLLRELRKLRDKNQAQWAEIKKLEFDLETLEEIYAEGIEEERFLRRKLKDTAKRLSDLQNFVKAKFNKNCQ